MAKQTVNLGSSANDGTGDPLRTAFDKINDNFDELYLYNSAGSGNNIEITGNTIATDNTNGDITLDPNGTGRVILATASELRFTDHVDNAIAYVDADGDGLFTANDKLVGRARIKKPYRSMGQGELLEFEAYGTITAFNALDTSSSGSHADLSSDAGLTFGLPDGDVAAVFKRIFLPEDYL